MDQLHTIKNLINRKSFSLSDKQNQFLHKVFYSFFEQRRNFKQAEMRAKIMQEKKTYPVWQKEFGLQSRNSHALQGYQSDSMLDQQSYSYKEVKKSRSNSFAIATTPKTQTPNQTPISPIIEAQLKPITNKPVKTAPSSNDFKLQNKRRQRQQSSSSRRTESHPLCILMIQLDEELVEEIKVYKEDDPRELAWAFARKFRLSDSARNRLYE